MDLRDTPDDRSFREALAAWLEGAVLAHGAPPPAHDWAARRAYDTAWQRKLYDAGYSGLDWPREYGGQGASYARQLIYYEELARAHAPHIGVNFVGLQHGGPTLVACGTPEQKAAHLPRILRGEEVWCQGFSEPGAGSDLAALSTRAVRDGDAYAITGQKIWCSFAHVADFCELLVRTAPEAPKHKGITWLVLPMRAPGIEVRPMRTILGESEFSEVFLDGVRVPVTNRVGAENDGWAVANVTLRFERGTSFAGWIVELRQVCAAIAALARGAGANEDVARMPRSGAGANEEVVSDEEIGRAAADVEALWALVKLSVCEAGASGVPSANGSSVKLFYTELYQRISELGLRLLQRRALARAADGRVDLVARALHSLSMTVAAGTSQIQRNIVAERILGLPKEPRVSGGG